jgi:hypothetical protein
VSVLLLAFQLALGILVPWWILRRDLLQLDDERLGRAWTLPSFWSAIVLFGPLCLPFHFAKTRRSLRGLGLGLVWMVVAFAAIGVAAAALALLLGVE